MDFPFSRDKLPLTGGVATAGALRRAAVVPRAPVTVARPSAPGARIVARPYVPAGLPTIPNLGSFGKAPPTVPSKGAPGGYGNPLTSAGEGSMDMTKYFGGDVAGWQSGRLGPGQAGDDGGLGAIHDASDFASGRGSVFQDETPGGGPSSDGQARDEGAYSHRSKDHRPFIPGLGDQLNMSMFPIDVTRRRGAPDLPSAGSSRLGANPFGAFTSDAELAGNYGRGGGRLRPSATGPTTPFMFPLSGDGSDPRHPGAGVSSTAGAAPGQPPPATPLTPDGVQQILALKRRADEQKRKIDARDDPADAKKIYRDLVDQQFQADVQIVIANDQLLQAFRAAASKKPPKGDYPTPGNPLDKRPPPAGNPPPPPKPVAAFPYEGDAGGTGGPRAAGAIRDALPSDEPGSPVAPRASDYLPSDENRSPMGPRSSAFRPGEDGRSPIGPRTRIVTARHAASGVRLERDVFPDPNDANGPTGPRT